MYKFFRVEVALFARKRRKTPKKGPFWPILAKSGQKVPKNGPFSAGETPIAQPLLAELLAFFHGMCTGTRATRWGEREVFRVRTPSPAPSFMLLAPAPDIGDIGDIANIGDIDDPSQ